MINFDDHTWPSRGAGSRRGGAFRGRGGRGNRMNKYHGKRNKQPILPELIEPNKVFIRNVNKNVTDELLKSYVSQFVTVVNLRVIRRLGSAGFKPYAFVEVENKDDVEKLLKLEKSNCYLNGLCLNFQPARRHFKIPGMVDFKKIPLSDRDFDLEPADASKPSIHMLIDDVLLKVFEYLPIKVILIMDGVCRRWQSLIHACFRQKARIDIKGDINFWLMKNQILPSLALISKVLIFCGENLTKLSVGELSGPRSEGRLLRVIGQLCPSLESLTLYNVVCIHNTYLKDLVGSCRNLKSFTIKDRSAFNEANLTHMLVNLPNLEVLELEESEIYGRCFDQLPSTLKVLNLVKSSCVDQRAVSLILERCSLIEVLHLEGICITSKMIEEIGKKCPLIKDLGVEIIGPCVRTSMSDFKNLKKLRYLGCIYSIGSLIKDLPQLEELVLDGLITVSATEIIDFSKLENLSVLILPLYKTTFFNNPSIQTISYCTNLVKLKFKGSTENKTAILDLIRRCSTLRELDCQTITLSAEDIPAFVDANKKREHRLKLVIGLDKGALDQIENLNDANYDVDMFDVHNIFSDFSLYDEFDDILNMDADSEDSIADFGDEYDFLFSDDDEQFFDPFMDPSLDIYFNHQYFHHYHGGDSSQDSDYCY